MQESLANKQGVVDAANNDAKHMELLFTVAIDEITSYLCILRERKCAGNSFEDSSDEEEDKNEEHLRNSPDGVVLVIFNLLVV